MRKYILIIFLVVCSLSVQALGEPVSVKAKPTKEQWQAKKKAKNKDKDDYLKKKQAYLDNPTPGKLNAMNVARAKFQAAAKDCRKDRESMKRD